MVVTMPVLAPGGCLEGAQPPDVLGGVDAFVKPRLQMQDAVDDALPVQCVHQAYRANPEEARPTEEKITEAERQRDDRDLDPVPEPVAWTVQIRAPSLHTRSLPLVQPAEVRPTRNRRGGDWIRLRLCRTWRDGDDGLRPRWSARRKR